MFIFKRLIFLLFVLVSFSLATQTWAQSDTASPNSASNTSKNSAENTRWLFTGGDDSTYSTLEYDDSDWTPVSLPSLVKSNQQGSNIGWYRLHFNWNGQASADLSLFIERIRLGDETWLNGVKIGSTGVLSKTWKFDGYHPQGLPRVYNLPQELLLKGENLLAIKINTSFGGVLSATYPGGTGITGKEISIDHHLNQVEKSQALVIKSIAFDSALITLGLLDIVLLMLLAGISIKVTHEFTWLLASSLTLFLGTLGLDFFYLFGIKSHYTNHFLFVVLLIAPLFCGLYFHTQRHDLKPSVIRYFVVIYSFISLVLLIPFSNIPLKDNIWLLWEVMAAVIYGYCLISAVIRINQRRVGAWAQLLGLVIYIISIRTQWLPNALFEHRNAQIGSLVYRYMLLLAYFQQLHQLRIDYKNVSKRIVHMVDNTRKEIARDLHDGMGQNLSSAILHANIIKQNPDISEKSKSALSIITSELSLGIANMRNIISRLHPSVLDHKSLAESVEAYSQKLMDTHSTTIICSFKSEALTKIVETHLFRIIQECLHNAIKHGHAENIKVSLHQESNVLYLTIEDNGVGINLLNAQQPMPNGKEDAGGGFGFVSLKDRVAILAGQIEWQKMPHGTRVEVKIPCNLV